MYTTLKRDGPKIETNWNQTVMTIKGGEIRRHFERVFFKIDQKLEWKYTVLNSNRSVYQKWAVLGQLGLIKKFIFWVILRSGAVMWFINILAIFGHSEFLAYLTIS